ncbi:DUF4238 domain-containing protein [Salinarimonas soli]|uniref:DUF4238 domain-containing protein n=1 Tax=Salinarimonas soli TaxID=1638099 RepID=UPI001661E124|nr:DUF4238 domain-containing protein [Salinarimonas soli]
MGGASTQKPSWRHHFIPEFYLKRWSLGGTKLVQFSRPYGSTVKPKTLSPRETGFQDKLYTLAGLDPELAQALEEQYFQKIDGAAADALARLHAKPGSELTKRERVGWTQFLVSLWTRNPEEVEATKQVYAANWTKTTPKMEEAYFSAKRPNDPPTFAEYLATVSKEFVERNAMLALANRGKPLHSTLHIANMKWGSLKTPFWTEALLTSDRPIIRYGGLAIDDAYIVMPIRPKHIFFSVNTPYAGRALIEQEPSKLVAEMNKQVTQQAHWFVYATTDRPLVFVQEHMSQKPAPIIAKKIKLFPSGHRINPRALRRGEQLREYYRDIPI